MKLSKSIFITLIILFSNVTFGQKANNPFLKLKVDSIVFYDFGGNPEDEVVSIIQKDDKLSYSVIKSVKLDKITGDYFTKLIGKKESYGGSTAQCFEPHLGVVYYYNKKPIAYINICLSCNKLSSSLAIKSQLQGKNGEGDKVYYTLDGMSNTFRQSIIALLVKFNFSHKLDGRKIFDK